MNATVPMNAAQSKAVRRGFPSLPCILCGNADGNVTVSLEDVSQFHCNECGEDFDADDVRQFVGQWQAVLAWCDAAPAIQD
jgi:hypothetical protein